MINESEFTSNTASDGLIIWYWSHFVQLGSDLSLNLGPKLSAKLTFETSKQTSNKPPNKLGLSWAKLSSNWNWNWILLKDLSIVPDLKFSHYIQNVIQI